MYPVETESLKTSTENKNRKKLPQKRRLGVDDFTQKFYKIFKDQMFPMMHRWFENIIRNTNYFNEASIILVTNLIKIVKREKNHRLISLRYISAKILNK